MKVKTTGEANRRDMVEDEVSGSGKQA